MRLDLLFGFALILGALACHGCSDDFDPSSRVTDLRVLAVRADHPSAAPGQRVQLEALYHDPQGRALSWAWGPCGDSASSTATACAESLDLARLTVGSSASFSFDVPDGLGASDTFGIAVVACPGSISAGNTASIPLACLDAEGKPLAIGAFEVGMKRLFVRERTENHNPAIEMVLWDGELWPEGEVREARCEGDDGRCKKHTIEVRAPNAAEHRVDDAGHTLREQVIIQFYGSGGTFEDDVRPFEEPDTTWQPRAEDRGRELTLWFVVRDDRGGVSWVARSVSVP